MDDTGDAGDADVAGDTGAAGAATLHRAALRRFEQPVFHEQALKVFDLKRLGDDEHLVAVDGAGEVAVVVGLLIWLALIFES